MGTMRVNKDPRAFTGVGYTKHEYITVPITKLLNYSKEHNLVVEEVAVDAKRVLMTLKQCHCMCISQNVPVHSNADNLLQFGHVS